MTNVELTKDDQAEVLRAVALLKLRTESNRNVYARMALERKIKDVPERILKLAQANLAKSKPSKPSSASKLGERATLQSADLTTAFMAPNGHQMTFRMTVKLPKKKGPGVSPGEKEIPRDLYGAYFEWWEEIIVDYDFKEPPVKDPTDAEAVQDRAERIADRKAKNEGGSTKPWSDIYLSNPQSQTFNTWKGTLQKAAAGEVSGTVTTGLEDRPALSASADSFKRRTLRFRINAGDDGGPKFKADAIQVIVVEDGKHASIVYQDSTGTDLKSGSGESEVMRYRPSVSSKVRGKDAVDFVEAVEGDKAECRKFDNTELDQITARLDKNDILSQVHKDVNKSNELHAMPLIPGSDEYWEYDASDGGLLVAQLSGGKVKRLYHTDNSPKEVEIFIGGKRQNITARTFEQLPLE